MFKLILSLYLIFIVQSSLKAELKFVGQEYPPFNYIENGKVKGEFVTIIKSVCEKIAEKCTVEINSLKRAMHEIENGNADVGITFIKSPERELFAEFYPMYRSKQVYWGKAEMPIFKTLNDLSGKTIVSVQGSKSLELAKSHAEKIKDVKVVEAVSNDVALRMLSSDRFGDKGVALVNEIPGKYFVEKYFFNNIKIVYPIKTDTYGFYFSKKSKKQEAMKKFKAELIRLKKNKELKNMYDKIAVELASMEYDEYKI